MGARQLSLILGPVIAGFVIAVSAHQVSTKALPDAHGLGIAFCIDAASFLFSLASLTMVRIHGDFHSAKTYAGVLASVAAGIRNVWSDAPLRAFVLYVAVVSVFVSGPIGIGLPVLADTRLDLGAASLGILMTANGVGIFAGSFLSGIGTRLLRGHLGMMVLCIDSLVGLALVGVAFVHTTISAAVLLLCTGLLGGMAQISIFTWIQQRVPQAMMGRTMSVLMFTFMGLGPLSAAVAGALLKVISLTALFSIAGLALAIIALCCLASPQLRGIRAVPNVPEQNLAS